MRSILWGLLDLSCGDIYKYISTLAAPSSEHAATGEQVLSGGSARQRERHSGRLVRTRRVPRDHIVHRDKTGGEQEDPGFVLGRLHLSGDWCRLAGGQVVIRQRTEQLRRCRPVPVVGLQQWRRRRGGGGAATPTSRAGGSGQRVDQAADGHLGRHRGYGHHRGGGRDDVSEQTLLTQQVPGLHISSR